MKPYINHHEGWPKYTWDNDALVVLLGRVRNLQGNLTGRMESLGGDARNEATLEIMTLDLLKSFEIEGKLLDPNQVRQAAGRRLGLKAPGFAEPGPQVESAVEMAFDAVLNYDRPMSEERLVAWHAGLFPLKGNRFYQSQSGRWRPDVAGPVQAFIAWFNDGEETVDPVIKAAIAHLWFTAHHPFDDGNGLIARALTDILLARADGCPRRFYSLSRQIRANRQGYYEILGKNRQGVLEITSWLEWFLQSLMKAMNDAGQTLADVLFRANFWNRPEAAGVNGRQKLMLNSLLGGYSGVLTTSAWAKATGCSADSALRDIHDLAARKILRKGAGGGRSTHYVLAGAPGR